jgi:hypothetical protein
MVISMQAQNRYNLIFFAENGEKFVVILNGVVQNKTPATNVQVTDLKASGYKVRIDFEQEELGFFDKNVFMPEESMEITFNIKRNNKGKWVMKQYATATVPTSPKTMNDYETVSYRESDEDPIVESTSANAVTTTTTTTKTTTSENPSQKETVTISMAMSETSAGADIQVSDGSGSESMTTQTSTTTVTTTEEYQEEIEVVDNQHGCDAPMNSGDFKNALETIESKDFEDSRLSIAEQVAERNCLDSEQVKEIMFLFEFEETRLEFAKFAHSRVYDPGNYFKVQDAFDYESSIQSLNEYIDRF